MKAGWLRKLFTDPPGVVKNAVLDAGYGRCYACQESWRTAINHTTEYALGRGCFPFCETCFWSVDRDLLISGYYNLMCRWRSGGSWITPEAAAHVVNAALRERGEVDGWREDYLSPDVTLGAKS